MTTKDPPTAAEVTAALEHVRVLAARIAEAGESAFSGSTVDADLLQFAACHLIVRLQSVLEDLPESALSQNADLPFAAVRGMRNRLAHGYSDIDVTMLWETISSAIPTFIDELLSRLPPDG